MKKLTMTIILVFLSSISNAEEIDEKYQQILFNYANTALMEFSYQNPLVPERNFDIKNAFFIKGIDKIGRVFYVVLFSKNEGNLYVSMELSKDGLLAIHGRGGVNVTPEDLKSDFNAHIGKMVHYPGST